MIELIIFVHWVVVLFLLGGTAAYLITRKHALWHVPFFTISAFVQKVLYKGDCPLTLWEQDLRTVCGCGEYTGSFIVHYLDLWFEVTVSESFVTHLFTIAFVITVLVTVYKACKWWESKKNRAYN